MIRLLLLCLVGAVSTRSPAKFIIGGDEALEGDWPEKLSVRNMGTHSCAGTLIAAHWAVTAAHCIGGPSTAYTIVAGTNDRLCSASCIERAVGNVTRHPGFIDSVAQGNPNDVAVVNWAQPIMEEVGVTEYAIMASTNDQIGMDCYIAGWGRNTPTGSMPDMLHEALMNLLTTAQCQTLWPTQQISDNHVCLLDQATEAISACNGDSGGPLVCERSPDEWEFVGLISWHSTTCDGTQPTVCTRVSAYRDWILEQTGPI